jgi:subtilisin
VKNVYGLAVAVLLLVVLGASVLAAPRPVTSVSPPPPAYTALLQQARQQGSLAILVRLNSPARPETALSARETADQRGSIARVQERLLARLQQHHVTLHHAYTTLPGIALTVDAAALQTLIDSPDVAHIRRDSYARPLLTTTIPIIGAAPVWEAGYTGAGQAVAVLDTGVDKTHPMLQGRVVAEACFSLENPVLNNYSVCPNGASRQIGSGAGVNCTGFDFCSHGTHVAGIVAGQNELASGVAPGASLIAVQVGSKVDNPQVCGADNTPCLLMLRSDIIAALEYVYQLRTRYSIAAVNLSLGEESSASVCDDEDPLYTRAVNNLTEANIAVVAAAGNNGSSDSLNVPACISAAISVGATTDDDAVASFSDSATTLDLLAPGVKVVSSVPGGEYASFSGTSQSAPHVAGAWALLRQYQPEATVAQLLAVLRTTEPITNYDNNVTTPRIQLDAALAALQGTYLEISKSASREMVEPSQALTYTLQVRNPGATDANGVTITDAVPEGTTFVAASDSGTLVDGVVTWDNLSVRGGSTLVRTLRVAVDPLVAGASARGARPQQNSLPPIVNQASVAVGSKRYTSNTVQTAVVYDASQINAAMEVALRAGTDTVRVGHPISYTIRVTNTGTIMLAELMASDAQLGAVPLDTTTLAPQAVAVGTLVYTVTQDDLPGPLQRTITAQAQPTVGATVSASDRVSVTIATTPAIAVGRTANRDSALVGDAITFTYTVTNTGDIDISNVIIRDSRFGAVAPGTTSLVPAQRTTGTLVYTVTESDLPGPIKSTITASGVPVVGEPVSATTEGSVVLVKDLVVLSEVYLPRVER